MYLAQFRTEKASARLSDALNARDANAFGQARQQLAADAQTAAAALKGIAPFRGKDARYRDAARNLVNYYAGFATTQAPQMQELLARQDRFTKADADRMNGLVGAYNTQNTKLVNAYNQAGNAFQAAYIPVFND